MKREPEKETIKEVDKWSWLGNAFFFTKKKKKKKKKNEKNWKKNKEKIIINK